jgi:hypothetical protein
MAPPLLFGASVSLAIYLAFWLQLDDPFWAGTSAAIVCQPQLGASLRKGWFRMIGTLIGAIVSVLLPACLPQDRVLFLGCLALWTATCACVATLLRHFAAIIAGGLLGVTGGVNADAGFLLAVARASARSASASPVPASFFCSRILAARDGASPRLSAPSRRA